MASHTLGGIGSHTLGTTFGATLGAAFGSGSGGEGSFHWFLVKAEQLHNDEVGRLRAESERYLRELQRLRVTASTPHHVSHQVPTERTYAADSHLPGAYPEEEANSPSSATEVMPDVLGTTLLSRGARRKSSLLKVEVPAALEEELSLRMTGDPGQTASMGHRASLGERKSLARLQDKHRMQLRARLCTVLEIDFHSADKKLISLEHLFNIINKRGMSLHWTRDRLKDVLQELQTITTRHGQQLANPNVLRRADTDDDSKCSKTLDGVTSKATAPHGRRLSITSRMGTLARLNNLSIQFDALVSALAMKDLPSYADPDMCDDVELFQKAMLEESEMASVMMLLLGLDGDVGERMPSNHTHLSAGLRKFIQPTKRGMMRLLNSVVSFAVFLSLALLAVSSDIHPEWHGWLLCETVLGSVFLIELVVKVSVEGRQSYFYGEERHWNWLDTAVNVLTILDLVFSYAFLGQEENDGVNAVRVAIMFRILRVARLTRLVKLLKHPFFRDLANLLAGLLIGMPWLFWVLVLLFLILYSMGVCLRLMLGPTGSVKETMDRCGSGDSSAVAFPDDAECQNVHLLYGEEFFGDVPTSMFTLFRCLIGDCSTRTGQSLTAHFAEGYGTRFYVLYGVGMICIIFGLFNVITALFVESTLSGLKYNDVQKKYARMYESRYVYQKMSQLIQRIRHLHPTGEKEMANMTVTRDDFQLLIKDRRVNSLLDDLDVASMGRADLFELVDFDRDGVITLPDMVVGMMKLRGDTQKSDIMANWVAIRTLHDRFVDFERTAIELHHHVTQLILETGVSNSRGVDVA